MHRWEGNIRMNLREIGWKGMDWIHLAQDRDQWCIGPLELIKGGKFDWLNECYLLKQDSVLSLSWLVWFGLVCWSVGRSVVCLFSHSVGWSVTELRLSVC
jgi:hypothetical protein